MKFADKETLMKAGSDVFDGVTSFVKGCAKIVKGLVLLLLFVGAFSLEGWQELFSALKDKNASTKKKTKSAKAKSKNTKASASTTTKPPLNDDGAWLELRAK